MKRSSILTLAVCTGFTIAARAADGPQFMETFKVEKADLSATGKSSYFILDPGFVAIYEGKEDGKKATLTITVTDQTKVVDGVETRVVEEKETSDGEVIEISRNYMAISKTTGDVYYFGEDTDIYKNGKIVDHEGSWLSGVAGARFGLLMPGKPKVGDAYYQEQAPKVAMDRAKVVSVGETLKTPAGNFKDCVKTEESTPLESGKEYKLYAPGVGLIQDADLLLVRYGKDAK